MSLIHRNIFFYHVADEPTSYIDGKVEKVISGDNGRRQSIDYEVLRDDFLTDSWTPLYVLVIVYQGDLYRSPCSVFNIETKLS